MVLGIFIAIAVATILVEIAAGAVVLQFLTQLDGAKNSVTTSFDKRVDDAISETFCDCCNITTATYGCNTPGVRMRSGLDAVIG